ncbi:MAG TPA: NAD(P)-dependent oxidoreductase [Burkholderiales bacterium]|nr:NAD(P)-dependent oxidoreductase [Burkholderiales bacterium]
MKVFLAGALGIIGRPLAFLLLSQRHEVVGTTRSADRIPELEALGVTPVALDALDRSAVMKALSAAKPDVLIHQLTDLPDIYRPEQVDSDRQRNAHLRVVGTANLASAARDYGVRRLIAQSIAFVYAPGRKPHLEEDALDEGASDSTRIAVEGVLALERTVMSTPGVEGIVLRYGRLYGPGTWFSEKPASPVVHPDAAAHAALLALTEGDPGIYNVAEDDGSVSIARARQQLGFDPAFRLDH